MRTFILFILSCVIFNFAISQTDAVDSLNNVLHKTRNDTLRLVLYSRLGDAQLEVNFDSALFCAQQYLQLSQKLNYKLNEADALQQEAEYLVERASAGNALELGFKALQLAEDAKKEDNIPPPGYLAMLHVSDPLFSYSQYRLYIIGKVNNTIGGVYSWDRKSLSYYRKAKGIADSLHATELLISAYEGLAMSTTKDSALMYLKESYQLAKQIGYKKHIPQIAGGIVHLYHDMGDHVSEINLLRATFEFCVQEKRLLRVGYSYLVLANYLYQETNSKDSALLLAMQGLQLAKQIHSPYLELIASQELTIFYNTKNIKDSAFKYLEMYMAATEKTTNEEKQRQFLYAEFLHQQQQTAIEATRKQYRSQIKMYGLLAGLLAFLIVTIILWRNNKHRQKAFGLLQKQKEQTEQALQELKSTQTQLIQKEKMASLGELTAGIAHEIQNPLNFVNNFSEINTELIGELREQQKKEDRNFKMEDDLLIGIKDNEEKINYHGKRADAIVKGMLQHSRSSEGKKEATDINALTDEYLRLSYHGMRAKDSSFKATIKTDFDKNVGVVNIVPQDIGRVLLNLYNNAFYAVGERYRVKGLGYEPTVSISTKKVNDKIEISVKDNGNGIPENVIGKIFQPFFTTKPSGQGTGLGLSLSYDIVKAHGGEIKVKTKAQVGLPAEASAEAGSEFVVQLPL